MASVTDSTQTMLGPYAGSKVWREKCSNSLCSASETFFACKCGTRYCSTACLKDHSLRGHKELCSTICARNDSPEWKQFERLAKHFFSVAHNWDYLNSWIWTDAENARKGGDTHFLIRFLFSSVEDLEGMLAGCLACLTGHTTQSGFPVEIQVCKAEPLWRTDPSRKGQYDILHSPLYKCFSGTLVCVEIPASDGRTMFTRSEFVKSPHTNAVGHIPIVCALQGGGRKARKHLFKEVKKTFRKAGASLENAAPDLAAQLTVYIDSGNGFEKHMNLPGSKTLHVYAPTDKDVVKFSPFSSPSRFDMADPDGKSRRLTQRAKHIVHTEAQKCNIELAELGPRLAEIYGRGSFHVRFASSADLDQGKPETIDETMQRLTCAPEFSKRLSMLPPGKCTVLLKELRNHLAPAHEGQIGCIVAYVPSATLVSQYEDKSMRDVNLFQTYDPSSAFLCSAEVTLPASIEVVLTAVVATMFAQPAAGAKLWKNTLREYYVQGGLNLEGELVTASNPLGMLSDPLMHLLLERTMSFLAPWQFWKSKDKETVLTHYPIFAMYVNRYLQDLPPDIEDDHWKVIREGDPRLVFAAILTAQPDARQLLHVIWNLFGGEELYLSELATFRDEEHKARIAELVRAGILSRCSSCGTTAAKLMKCARCASVAYCDSTCQRNHWKLHKTCCKVQAKANHEK